MTKQSPDIIDLLAGIDPGSRLDEVRALRPEARKNAQESYRVLFEAQDFDSVSALERFALAAFVSGLHRQKEASDFYATGLRRHGEQTIAAAVASEVSRGVTNGPYGTYPSGPLSSEDEAGLVFAVSSQARAVLGERLSAALEHAHLLVFRPRDASPQALEKLINAGWSTTGIVTISQVIAFLAFQVRVIAGLRAIRAAPRLNNAGDLTLELASAAASARL